MKSKKLIHYFMAVLMFSFVLLLGSANEVKAATYVPFSVNLFDYNTGKSSSDETDMGTINRSLQNAGSNFRFRWNTLFPHSYEVNSYTSSQRQGIVKNELLDGMIQFNNNYNPESVGLFDPDVQVDGKSVYTNVQLPFQYASGYYTFDSSEYDVYFQDGAGASGTTLIANETTRPVMGFTNFSNETKKGFFPFNGRRNNNESANYHFGMTFSTEFFMTENGRINNQDIVFEFSGDDDIWVFVDGKLVLDMGGIHAEVNGKVNFANGTSIIGTNTNGTNRGGSTQGDLWELLDTTADEWRNSTTPHTLQIFYLERGAGASNCKIKFNLPQKNCISVTKVMGNNPRSQEELDRLNELSFDFIAYTKSGNTQAAKALANRVYYLYDSTGKLLGGYRTDNQGRFSLKFGQNAKFYIDNEYSEQEVYVVEQQSLKLVSLEWSAAKNNDKAVTKFAENPKGDAYKSPSLTIDPLKANASTAIQMYAFVCKNEVDNPQAVNDIVVLDYGKPVQINILKNDTFFNDSPNIRMKAKDAATYDKTSLTLANGTAVLKKNVVEYTPTDFMTSVDRFDYSITSTEGDSTAEVQIMPATSVYYEDNFAATNGGNTKIVFSGGVTQVGSSVADKQVQSEENIVYGYDASYVGETGDSNGTSSSMAAGATATFTFDGTGVEIYSRTDEKSPVIIGRVYAIEGKTETLAKAIIVDNKYDMGTLYQIPTICFDMEKYGTYKVVLTVSGTQENSNYYLDGIRIYNPIDVNAQTQDAVDAQNAYQAAAENAAFIQEVRDILIDANSFTGNASVNGVVYLDISTEGAPTIQDYVKDGPKNEVYLGKGNAIAFTLKPNGTNYSDDNKVYIGLKAPEGNSTTVSITEGTTRKQISIDGAADLYYKITPTSNGQVVIQNTGENLLAITRVRVSDVLQADDMAQKASVFVVDEETIAYAQTFSMLRETAPEDDEEIEDGDVVIPDVDIDVDIDNSDNSDHAGSQIPSKQEKITNFIKGLATGILKLFGMI